MDSWFPTFRRIANKAMPLPAWSLRRANAAQRQALLRLIAVATEENLPLSPLIEAWASDERRSQRHRLERLAQLLKAGSPLAEAVEQIPGVLRDEDLLAIRFDTQLGTRTAAVREMLEDTRPSPTNRPSALRGNAVYFGVVLLIAFLVVSFIQIKIAPEFNKILEEFDLNPPEVVRFSDRLSAVIGNYWWLGALAALVLLWSMFSATPGRFLRNTFLGRFFSPLRESLAADVLEKLGIATDAGRPIAGALSTLARYHFDPIIRHKLLFVRNEVEQGVDVWQSMTAVGILTSPDVRLLKTAERVGNRTWALEQLADVKRRRTARRLQRLSDMLLPTMVLAIGAVVLFQSLTVFLPLTEILGSLL